MFLKEGGKLQKMTADYKNKSGSSSPTYPVVSSQWRATTVEQWK